MYHSMRNRWLFGYKRMIWLSIRINETEKSMLRCP